MINISPCNTFLEFKIVNIFYKHITQILSPLPPSNKILPVALYAHQQLLWFIPVLKLLLVIIVIGEYKDTGFVHL